MSTFSDWEEKGRKLFEIILKCGKVNDYWFSSDLYSIWDVKYKTDKVLNVVEIKVRNSPYNKYPDWILEEKKYKALLAEADEFSALYVNFFSDNYFAIWNLNTINKKSIIKGCKKTTVDNVGYKNKDVIMLTLDEATLFGKIENESITIIKEPIWKQ